MPASVGSISCHRQGRESPPVHISRCFKPIRPCDLCGRQIMDLRGLRSLPDPGDDNSER